MLRASGSLLSDLGVGPPGVRRRELLQDVPGMTPVLQAEHRRGQRVGGTSGPRCLLHRTHIFPTLERPRSVKCFSTWPHACQANVAAYVPWLSLSLLITV